MKRAILALFALAFATLSAHAQFGPQPGPGPVPSPWVTNGQGIYYSGCVMVPQLVTGGCKGNGTGNFGALYVNGVAVSAGGAVNPGTAGQLGYYASNGSTISGLTPGNLIQENKGVSVLDPGTGSIEQVRPISAITGTSHVFVASDLFKYVTRANSGVAMTDTLPASNVLGLINGTPLVVSNIDATANITFTAGAGTTINGLSSLVLPAGTNVSLIYDFANTNWIKSSVSYNILPAANGGTGFATYAVGDVLFANTTSTLAKLADVATGNAIISGGVGVAPSYGKIGLTTHVSGILPVANGGTNLASGTSGGVLYYSGSGTLASSGALTANAITLGGGAGAAPTSLGSLGTTTTVLHGNAAGAPSFASVAYADIGASSLSTAGNFTGNAASTLLNPNAVWSGAAPFALTDAATVLVDQSAGVNFSLTIGGNRQLGFPSNTKAGQTGAIRVLQDATGTRTLSYAAGYKWSGGTACVIAPAANAVTYIFYFTFSSSEILLNCVLNVQ